MDQPRNSIDVIRQASGEDAAADLICYIEDMVINRPLSAEEREAISVKANYWFLAAKLKGRLEVAETIKYTVAKTLPNLQHGTPLHRV